MHTPALTIFIVDDDASVRDSLALVLGLKGYRTQIFASAEAFLSAYSEEWSGCILLDVRMPAMSGLELQVELRKRNCELPIIVITAYGDVATARAALKAGAADFLEKPVEGDLLVDVLRSALAAGDERQSQASRTNDAGGSRALTAREQQVMALSEEGLPAKRIAENLGISPRTVEVYRSRIMQKIRRDKTGE